MSDEWRDVPGLGGRYQATADGRIRLMREVRPAMARDGYLKVTVYVNGTAKSMPAHRLVALAWLDNPRSAPQVNHLNGVRHDNRVANLEWCTQSENMKHSWRTGGSRYTEAMRESMARAIKASKESRGLRRTLKLPSALKLLSAGATQRQASEKLGVPEPTLSRWLSEDRKV